MQPTMAYVERLAREAGAILRAGYNKEHQGNFKGVIDLVTEVDHQSEADLLGEVRRDFPDHHIFSEESGVIQGNDEHIWYIDPLDGTVNYAHHIPIFCVSIPTPPLDRPFWAQYMTHCAMRCSPPNAGRALT